MVVVPVVVVVLVLLVVVVVVAVPVVVVVLVLLVVVVVVVVVRVVVLVGLLVRARVKRGGDWGAKVLGRVGGWVLGGGWEWGTQTQFMPRDTKQKVTAALLASFSMRIVFDAGVIFFHSHSKAAVLKLG